MIIYDVVRVIRDISPLVIGDVGIILEVSYGDELDNDDTEYGIAFYRDIGGHNLNGLCDINHGQWVYRQYIEKIGHIYNPFKKLTIPLFKNKYPNTICGVCNKELEARWEDNKVIITTQHACRNSERLTSSKIIKILSKYVG